MRHVGFVRTQENCKALLRLWDKTLTGDKSGLNSATKFRIVGIEKKIKTLDFLLCLELTIVICSHTEALCQTSQEKKMSLLEDKDIARGTIK